MAQEGTDSPSPVPTRTGLGAVVEAMRIPHWVKNSFVAAPILFSGLFRSPQAWAPCLSAVLAFCLLSSAVYLINDVADRQSDRAHPSKKNRPVASGRLSTAGALCAAGILLVIGIGIAVTIEVLTNAGFLRTGAASQPEIAPHPMGGMELVIWTLAFLALNLLYSFWLKTRAIIDVIVVAMGFVLRAMAGAAAISVPTSPWLVVCTFTLCLFIALTKRRSELLALPDGQAKATRGANWGYDLPSLELMLAVSTAMAILAYCLYCLAPSTVARMGSAHIVWTIPLVVYGIFRFNRNTRIWSTADPVAVLVRDRIMWIVVALYAVLVVLIRLYGPLPAIKAVLHV
ncbi:MAG: UbiA prenyltransferase family protein [Phycisphaerae bacterium]